MRRLYKKWTLSVWKMPKKTAMSKGEIERTRSDNKKTKLKSVFRNTSVVYLKRNDQDCPMLMIITHDVGTKISWIQGSHNGKCPIMVV